MHCHFRVQPREAPMSMSPFDRMLTFYDMEGINQAIFDSESGTVVKPIVRMAQD
jgi:Zn-dependent alcohol dehydrogenase